MRVNADSTLFDRLVSVRAIYWVVTVALGAAVLNGGCRRATPNQVVVYTSVDQVFSEPVFRTFERRGTQIRSLFDTEETKSTGVLNRLLTEAPNPQADVFWSGDPMRALVLVEKGLVERYIAPNASAIPEQFRAADGAWTGFAARARVILVNRNRVATGDAPRSIRDLASPQFKGQCAMANPLYGTTTMHVAALFAAWGDADAKAFLQAVKSNGVRIASSNGEVKRLVASGEAAIGLTDTDDAHEALEAKAPVDVVWPDQEGLGTLVMPTVVVLVKGGPHPDAGRRLIDFLLSAEVERRMAEKAAHMPLRGDVTVPGVRRIAEVRAMQVDYQRVAAEMQRIQPWLRDWVGL
ncbi:MAG: extracellular solute-binding protein [Myxococcales bacterium]|nr:extracellular solute-binding protein [Myxococcales bacterium]